MKEVTALLDEIHRTEARRIYATLLRLLGDWDLAEEALQEAFAAAAEQWPQRGVPASPRAWLVSAGRFKAIDALRRRRRTAEAVSLQAALDEGSADAAAAAEEIGDDRLRLIFVCCHPLLPLESSIALTLRTVAGLSTPAIARAFLKQEATIAQRLVRAQAKIREARVPFAVPEPSEWPARWQAVLRVIYLVFNAGYERVADERGDTEPSLAAEAIRLGRLLVRLSDDGEARGLLALMLFQESRRAARVDAEGGLVLLEEQDRSRWDRGMIEEAQTRLHEAWAADEVGTYTLQAAIAAEHARASPASRTDWARIVELYDLLQQADDSPVVALNRAVAVAMRDGAEAGLVLVEALLAQPRLAGYAPAWIAKAELCSRAGHHEAARAAFATTLSLPLAAAQRRQVERRLRTGAWRRTQ